MTSVTDICERMGTALRRQVARFRSADVLRAHGRLTIRSARDGDKHVVAPSGELDVHGAQKLEDELARVEATDADQIIVDLCGLAFIDSVGMSVLIHASARSRSTDNRC